MADLSGGERNASAAYDDFADQVDPESYASNREKVGLAQIESAARAALDAYDCGEFSAEFIAAMQGLEAALAGVCGGNLVPLRLPENFGPED